MHRAAAVSADCAFTADEHALKLLGVVAADQRNRLHLHGDIRLVEQLLLNREKVGIIQTEARLIA